MSNFLGEHFYITAMLCASDFIRANIVLQLLKYDAYQENVSYSVKYIALCAAGRRLTMEAGIQATFLAPGDAGISGLHVLSWVTDLATGEPVENATVTIFKQQSAMENVRRRSLCIFCPAGYGFVRKSTTKTDAFLDPSCINTPDIFH